MEEELPQARTDAGAAAARAAHAKDAHAALRDRAEALARDAGAQASAFAGWDK